MKWYRYLLRLDDNLWPKKIHERTPHGGRRRRRPLTIIEKPSDELHEK